MNTLYIITNDEDAASKIAHDLLITSVATTSNRCTAVAKAKEMKLKAYKIDVTISPCDPERTASPKPRWICESCDNYNAGPSCSRCGVPETADHASAEALALDLGEVWCTKIREHHGDPVAHAPSIDEYGRADRQAWLAVARRVMLLSNQKKTP
jgi:hypothetical protein